jgi:hypothetical protein
MDAFFLLAIMTILAVFALAAVTWGVDSREGSTDPRRSRYPVGLD